MDTYKGEKGYKTVLLPISVPDGNYCFGPSKEGRAVCCRYFDAHGGGSSCELRNVGIVRDNYGILKPDVCKNLKGE